MEKQQTAVEWLVNELDLSNDTFTMKIINQAKAMEKEQSECICVNVISRILDESEQGKEINSKEIFEDVYKQTFKSE